MHLMHHDPRSARSRLPDSIGLLIALLASLSPRAALAQERWSEVRKLLASDGQTNAYFGSRVSVSGDLALIGAPLDHGAGRFAGAAYVFDLSYGRELRKLLPHAPQPDDCFGWSIACWGGRALISTKPMEPTEANLGSVFVLDVATGREIRRLEAASRDDPFPLGASVALNGSIAAVGVPHSLHGIQTWPGAAYVFDIETGEQRLRVMQPDGEDGDFFGNDVLIHEGRLIVSAYRDTHHAIRCGSVYVFELKSGRLLHKITPADPAEDMAFGDSIAASGNRLVIAAYHDDDNGRNSGSVYVYDIRTAQQLHKITPSDGFEEQSFGRSVAVEAQRLVVGAANDDTRGRRAGATYLFDVATGEQITKLLASDGVEFDEFGVAVGLSGSHLLVGARGVDDRGWLAGAAYLFHADNLLAIEPDPLRGGEAASCRVHHMRASEPVWLVYSVRGAGHTWIPQLGLFADLAEPRLAFGPGVTDEHGNWTHTFNLPRVSTTRSLWLQALQRERKTRVATVQVEP